MRYEIGPSGGGGGGGGISEDFSVIQIVFTDIDVTEDHRMEVEIFGETRNFYLKSEPSTNEHLPTSDGTTPLRWAELCHNYLLNDTEITSNYKVDFNENDVAIVLTARVASPDYDMTMGSSTIVGVTVTTTTPGMAATPGTVEGVRMQVFKDGTELIGEDYKPLDASGSVKFEAQEYIHANLLTVPPPRFKLTAAAYFQNVYTDYFMKYRTVFTDRSSGVYSQRSYSDPDNVFCYALAGGLNREDLVLNNNLLLDFFNDAATKKKWLTWMPEVRITDKDETHSLFFAIQQPAYTTYKLMAHVYSADTGQTISLTPHVNVQYWRVVEFLTGYTQLGLSAYLDGKVNRWELWLVDNANNVISDVQTYVLDEEYRENTRYFRFRNSWGVYDSLRCTGVFESIIEHEREKVNYIENEPETSYNAPGAHTMVKEAQSFKANTGWLSKDFLTYLRDFMISSDIYEIVDDKLLRCLLTSKKTNLEKDKDYNHYLSFEYERSWDDFFFSRVKRFNLIKVSGTLKYDSAPNPGIPLIGWPVQLYKDGEVVDTCTTDNDGYYEFNVQPGDYTVTATAREGAVWFADFYDVLAIFDITFGIIFEGCTDFRLQSADVNETGVTDYDDCMLIFNRTFAPPDPGWTAPDWYFSTIDITVDGADLEDQDLLGICAGNIKGTNPNPNA
jgi:hypothetical protein